MRFSSFHLTRPIILLGALLVAALTASPTRAGVEDVLREVGEDGRAQVLVRMKADGGGAVPWSPRLSVSRQRVAVATAFNEAAPAFRRARVGGLKHFRTIPYLAATVTREQAMALAGEKSVEGIFLIRRERRAELKAPEGAQAAGLTAAQLSIDLGSAWDRGFDGAGFAVAVIDSGINVNHPALAGKNIGDACFANTFGTTTIAQCPSGATPQVGPGAASYCPADSTRCDHGTHVASVAVGNDGAQFGVARGARIVPIDVFSLVTDPAECSPDPAPCVLTDSLAVLNALDYVNEKALELRIAAVNLSIGGSFREGYCDDDPRKSVIDMLRQKGVAVAVAASNGGQTGKITTPACISSAIAVGATDNGTSVASFSNFASMLDFVAPGLSVSGAKGSGSGYGTRSGTSMSAPQVAGAFAVLRQAYPTLSIDALEAALKLTGTSVTRPDSGVSVAKIQVGAALDRLQGVNRRMFNNILAVDSHHGESMLRFFNPGDAPGNVRVTLRDGESGAYVGDWTSPTIPAHASLQFSAKSIQANAMRGGFPVVPQLRAYFNFDVASTFRGSAQHVLFNTQSGVISNLTNCGTALPTDNAKQLMNVHSGAVVGYQSRIRVVNTGAAPAAATLSFYNAGTGTKILDWPTPEIPSGAAFEVPITSLEARLTLPAGGLDGGNGTYNVTLGGFSGYLQHLVENLEPGALVDMTAKCDLAVSGSAFTAP
ncbi:MAG: S8 family serine peptidase [Rhodospirillaceae bacterium]